MLKTKSELYKGLSMYGTINNSDDKKSFNRIIIFTIRIFLIVFLLYIVFFKISFRDILILKDGREGIVISTNLETQVIQARINGNFEEVPINNVLSIRPGLLTLLNSIETNFFIAALFIGIFVPIITCPRFYAILAIFKPSIDFKATMHINLLSYLYNLPLPSSAGGDIYRIISIKKFGFSVSNAIKVIVADRISGLIALLLFMFITSILFLNDLRFHSFSLIIFLSSITIFVLLSFFIFIIRFEFSVKWHSLNNITTKLYQYSNTFFELYSNRKIFYKIIILSIFSQGLHLLAISVLAYAIGIEYFFVASFLVYPAAALLGVFAPTPQGLGAVEGVLVVALSTHVDGGASTCLLFAFSARLLRIIWAIPGIAFSLKESFFVLINKGTKML